VVEQGSPHYLADFYPVVLLLVARLNRIDIREN
jgi:hypothetical protein